MIVVLVLVLVLVSCVDINHTPLLKLVFKGAGRGCGVD